MTFEELWAISLFSVGYLQSWLPHELSRCARRTTRIELCLTYLMYSA